MKIRSQLSRKPRETSRPRPKFAMGPAKYVTALYDLVLGRPADYDGLNAFTKLIRETGDPTAVLKMMLDGDEYKLITGPEVSKRRDLKDRLEECWRQLYGRLVAAEAVTAVPDGQTGNVIDLVTAANQNPSDELAATLSEADDWKFVERCFELVNDGVGTPSELAGLLEVLNNKRTELSAAETTSVEAEARKQVLLETVSAAVSEPGKILWMTRSLGAGDDLGGDRPDVFQVEPGNVFSTHEWRELYRANLAAYESGALQSRGRARADSALKPSPEPALSIICSLYRGYQFMRPYLENITSLEGFGSCELVIIDANSPEREQEVIQEFQQKFDNIIYRRLDERIGIYDAWNVGIQLSRGRYLTNANLDDSRSPDSLVTAIQFLDEHDSIDVVYGEYHYSLVPHGAWEVIDAIGCTTSAPRLTTHRLLDQNHPHSAPVWRRDLHDQLGWFDTDFKSAGDWEFWLRCAAAGKQFAKIPRPLSVYYVNPEGISSAKSSVGPFEQWRIRERYRDMLIADDVVIEPLSIELVDLARGASTDTN